MLSPSAFSDLPQTERVSTIQEIMDNLPVTDGALFQVKQLANIPDPSDKLLLFVYTAIWRLVQAQETNNQELYDQTQQKVQTMIEHMAQIDDQTHARADADLDAILSTL